MNSSFPHSKLPPPTLLREADHPKPLPWARVRQAHDLLHMMITGDVPHPQVEGATEEQTLNELMRMCEPLCWALSHTNVPVFARRIAQLDAWLRAQGIVMEDIDGTLAEPFEDPEAPPVL